MPRSFLSPEQEAFRLRARAWLAEHPPPPEARSRDLYENFEARRRWQRTLFDGGWLGLAWPTEVGGQGLTGMEQVLFNQELALAEVPTPVGLIGLEVVGPTIVEFGSDTQRRQYVPPLLRGDEMWCQGFSEPDAGSDLASLRTRAEDDGDCFVVTGQKVWTSWAQFADWCALLVRTDRDAAKHRGISYLLVDMRSPGITVRPLTQMTGDEEFGEMFFDEVRVPRTNVLGGLNEGWRLALHTLEFERGPYALRRMAEVKVALRSLVRESAVALTQSGRDQAGDAVAGTLMAARLGEVTMLVDVLEARGFDTLSRLIRGAVGPESSLDKLFIAWVEQQVFGAGIDLLAPDRTLTADGDGIDRARWLHDYLYSRAASIYGGSAEIQRNIVADRVLGLPVGDRQQAGPIPPVLSADFLTAMGGETLVEVRSVAMDVLSREWAPEQRRQAEDAFPHKLWATFAGLGWFDLLQPDDGDDPGLGALAAAALFEAAGRFLLPGPLFASALVPRLLGTKPPGRGMLAYAHAGGSPAGAAGRATHWHDGRLSGQVSRVESADLAEAILVVTDTDHGPAMVVVSPADPGVRLSRMASVDRCIRRFAVEFDQAQAGEPVPISAPQLAAVEAFGQVTTAARLFGVMTAVRDMSVAYVADRRQFGQPIASFQAIRHRLADLEVLVRTTGNAVYVAAAALDSASDERFRHAASAKAWAARAGRQAVESALQVHGGIGFTADHDLHLYFKHALTLQGEWGDGTELTHRLGRAALDGLPG